LKKGAKIWRKEANNAVVAAQAQAARGQERGRENVTRHENTHWTIK